MTETFGNDSVDDLKSNEENQNIPKEKGVAEISKSGYALLKKNRIDDAIDCFSKILMLDENNNYALVGMGDAYRKLGSINDAVKYYQRCLSSHPGNNYALFGLADCYKTMNQYRKAIEIWEQYLLFDDGNITVLTRIADAYRKVRNFINSKKIYQRVLEIDEDNAYAIIGLGHLHYDFKEYREALFYLEKMTKSGKENLDIRVLTSIGNCYRKLKIFDEGIPFFEAALRNDANNFYALLGLADCYRGLNRTQNAVNYYSLILEHDPGNKMILTRMGDAFRNMNEFEKSKEYYNKALNIEFDTYAVLGLALLLKQQGKLDEAVTSLKQLIQQDNKNYRLYTELSDCYLKMGEQRNAHETLENFHKRSVNNKKIKEMLESI